MTRFTVKVEVEAPVERCFDLARSMDFHTWSMRATRECIVAGRASGLIRQDEEVEFEARHLGMKRRLRARISEYERPLRFTDVQTAGPFRSLTHFHTFERLDSSRTRVSDALEFDIGFGPAGKAVERLMILPHLRRLIRQHQRNLKVAAETEEWRRFLSASAL